VLLLRAGHLARPVSVVRPPRSRARAASTGRVARRPAAARLDGGPARVLLRRGFEAARLHPARPRPARDPDGPRGREAARGPDVEPRGGARDCRPRGPRGGRPRVPARPRRAGLGDHAAPRGLGGGGGAPLLPPPPP